MTLITSIQLQLNTGSMDGAGTDGDVYLGVCGREFYVDSSANDFERGSSRLYIFGDGANVINPPNNDPRKQSLHIENVGNFPVYLRFQPRSRTDNWNIQRAEVSFNGNFFPRWDTASVVFQPVGIWMGIRSSLFLHIPPHQDGTPGLATSPAAEAEQPES